jgi:hypothetical protein
MVGTAQIMIFIAGAAFLPHVLYHLIRFFKENLWRDVFWLSLFIGLHISAASPAYSIVLFYIIFKKVLRYKCILIHNDKSL